MDFFKPYLTKRYFLLFFFFFLLWYPGSFLLYTAYMATASDFFGVALNNYFLVLIFIFSFFYFKKSLNDWNDRLIVAFGWIALTFILAALLVKPIYGLDWTTIVNIPQITTNWGSFLIVLVAGMLVKQIQKKK
jgi:hypothetical protein